MKWIYILYWVIIVKDPNGKKEKVIMHRDCDKLSVAEYWEYKVIHEGNNKAIKTWIDSVQIPNK